MQHLEFFRLTAALLVGVILQGCSWPASYGYEQESARPRAVGVSPRFQQLFARTKRVCVGRYALEIPQEAEIRWGPASFPSDIKLIHGGLAAAKKRIDDDVKNIKEKNKGADIIYSQSGPVEGSWQIRFYEDEGFKRYGLLDIRTYINKGDITFIFEASASNGRGDTEPFIAEQQAILAKHLRLRNAKEIPDEPGFCIKDGFIYDKLYNNQEFSSAGIFFPSFPDINFSISSNKDAYADYSNWAVYKPKLSLLYRIAGAQKAQGLFYPSRTVLREGKRDVQHWQGEESLIRRKDGTHDFEWAFVGTPRDVANPSEYGARLYSKVAYDTVGAAKAASLTDDEAIALWDRLLSGLKFRVQVPGAPESSFYTRMVHP